MTQGIVQRHIMSFLNQQPHDMWHDTRTIANAAYDTSWATQEQIARTRQALRTLVRNGNVERAGFPAFPEWRSTYRHQRLTVEANRTG